jgi:hypothetical protein
MPPTDGLLPRRSLLHPDRLHFHRFLPTRTLDPLISPPFKEGHPPQSSLSP